MIFKRIILWLALAMLALLGSATTGSATTVSATTSSANTVPATASVPGEYVLATGDLVRVTVYDHPDLNTETRVSQQGSILFPLVGEVVVAGQTASQASGLVSKALQTGGFIKKPQVNVVIIEFKGQQVSVLGQVNRPGKFPLQNASRLAEVLALAGGVAASGADNLILISNQDGNSTRREIDLIALFKEGVHAFNVPIVNGDILFVPRESRFYIYGEVQRPGSFRLEQNMSLVQGLSVGGGLTSRGTQKGIKILRRNAAGAIREIDAKLADLLHQDDVIFVKESLF
jgi:polysaccharide biosynthesis/export protein